MESLESRTLRVLSLYMPQCALTCLMPTDCVSSQVMPATCVLTYLLLSRREIYLGSNQLSSLAGVTFPASLT